jgi:DNA invertase Pin-like site-specific DNA recombinase
LQGQGWIIVCVYEDHDSGSKADRAQFQAMMADAAQRRFDVLVFWALDRLTREGALETLQHLNRLSSYGVGFRSFTEPYLDSCGIFKDAVIAILGTIAKQERVRISERVRAGLDRAKSQGTKSGRPIGRPKAVFSRDRALELRAQGCSCARSRGRLGSAWQVCDVPARPQLKFDKCQPSVKREVSKLSRHGFDPCNDCRGLFPVVTQILCATGFRSQEV